MVDFAQLMASMPAGGQPVPGAVAGGRPLGGLLPDLAMGPLINLGANAIPLLSKPVMVAFMTPPKAGNSALSAAIRGMGDGFIKGAWNGAGFQYASIEPGAPIQAPGRFSGGGGFSLDV
jgi:hypothetical protein